MFGYTQEEALGKISVELMRPEYAPGERERKVKELEQTGILRTKIYAKHKNGTDIIVEQILHGSPINMDYLLAMWLFTVILLKEN